MRKFEQRDNPKAKERELKDNWGKILRKYGVTSSKRTRSEFKPLKSVTVVTRDTGPKIPSLSNHSGAGTKPEPKVYTGNQVVGIAVMHKSNLVPIFNSDAAVEVAQMRRG